MAILVNSQTVIFNDRTLKVSSGTTRPASPVTGMFWYNTSLSQLEVWNGTAWKAQNVSVGTKPQNALSWGRGLSGGLGDNTTTDRSSPASVVGGFTDWVQISVAQDQMSAIRANGTAWCWGYNGYGRLGDGTTTNRSSPVSVVGGFTDWVLISAGYTTHGIRANGTLWGWGMGATGAIGDNTTVSKQSPVSVVGGFTDWVQVSGGQWRAAALRANGTAWGWGYNSSGQIGDGTTTGRISPVQVVGGITDWVQLNAGGQHTVAIRATGTAWAWGNNGSGQLGDGTTTNRSSPVQVVGGFTNWVQISAVADGSTVAIRANGTAWSWGNGTNGILGDGTTVNKSSPVSVVGGFTDWVQVDAGHFHVSAIRANGTAWGWGRNQNGRLGDGTTTYRSSPVSVVGGFTDWVQISGGRTSTGAIRG